ncbi:septum formation initiator family protein [Antarcticibacterium flavum]|uniref:Septum formation initiator family protein n=1 Tax=Antarcticibacterium flavum TaxID=2058175 RepID=A0A5B7X699_9FLAO|nr:MULTISPECIES: septum formation initiator family protein [Antarcticibacterium]MCM4159305.1 septum formation initiator [Antarcticibacterium sp. W02-3]QCY70986.1 septum formation initiator family protein [Antarcticibacterium flavum]
MKLKDIRNKRWFRILSNRYVLILLIFAFWMFFLDSNSWLIHHELDQEINELQSNKEYYKKEIAKDRTVIEKLNDSFELENYARQNYYMKRPNEDIFIIEYDTIR